MKPSLPLPLIAALLLAPVVTINAAEPVVIDLNQRTWQGIPGLERTAKGRVYVSWFTGGPKEPSPDNTVVLSYSDDAGKTFTPPEAMGLPTNDGTRCFDPTLWIDPKGGVYFTDPRYGGRDGMEQDGEHVYYLSPDRKKLTRVISDMVRPNGVIGTPDGRTLYVADHGAGIVDAAPDAVLGAAGHVLQFDDVDG